jgi:hypothetical protein
VPLIAYIVKRRIKIATFDDEGSSIPLYVKNLTIVESKTITDVKIIIRRIQFFLFKFKEKPSNNFLIHL